MQIQRLQLEIKRAEDLQYLVDLVQWKSFEDALEEEKEQAMKYLLSTSETARNNAVLTLTAISKIEDLIELIFNRGIEAKDELEVIEDE